MKKLTASALIAAIVVMFTPLTFADEGATPGVSAIQTNATESTGGIAPSQGAGLGLGGLGAGTLLATLAIIATVAAATDGDNDTTGTVP